MAPQGLRGLIAESKLEEVIDIMHSDEEREKLKQVEMDKGKNKMMIKINMFQKTQFTP